MLVVMLSRLDESESKNGIQYRLVDQYMRQTYTATANTKYGGQNPSTLRLQITPNETVV